MTLQCQKKKHFVADNINAEPPTVSTTAFNQSQTFNANTLTSSAPTLDQATFTLIYNFNTGELISGAPIIPALVYDAALGRIANEAESQSFAELTMKSSNRCVIDSKPNKVELVA